MNIHLPPMSAADYDRAFRNATAPDVNYAFKGSNHRVFKKTPRFQETVFWNDANQYVGIFIVRGVWNGQKFSQKFFYGWRLGQLFLVDKRGIKYGE